MSASHAMDLDAYFQRVGYGGPAVPTMDTLRRLQVLHPAAIPFEAIDVLLDRGVDLAPDAVERKLVGARRGGYCFEHNGLFQRVLTAIGFEVEGLLARVRWQAAADAPPTPATHMTLRVILDGEAWLVDVGFGSALPTAPLRLNTLEPQTTDHEDYRLRPAGDNLILEARLGDDWMPLYEVLLEPRVEADYQVANWFTSTHQTSHFRHNLTVARTTPEARYALLDDRLTVRYPSGATQRRFLDVEGVREALAETFALPVAPDWQAAIERAVLNGSAARE